MGRDAVILKVEDAIDERFSFLSNDLTPMRLDSVQGEQEVGALFTKHPTLVFI